MHASRLVLALAATLVLAACDDDPAGPIDAGRVRAVHAVSNVTALDVRINTVSYASDLAYKNTDGYRSVVAGASSVTFRKADATADLLAANVTVADGTDYTVIALGTEAAPQSVVLTDDNAAPAAGKGKLRLVHAAAGADAVDAYVLANADELPTATAAATDLAVKEASAYVARDAGTFVVIFTEAGTKTPVLTLADVQIAAGKIRTVVAVEKAGGGAPLEGVVLADN